MMLSALLSETQDDAKVMVIWIEVGALFRNIPAWRLTKETGM
jgi:hypothetical protein